VVAAMKKPLWILVPALVFWIPAALMLGWTDTAVLSMKDETLTKDTQLFSYHDRETCPLQHQNSSTSLDYPRAYEDEGDWTQELVLASPGCDSDNYEMEHWSNREGNYQAEIAVNRFVERYRKMKEDGESMRQQSEMGK
jgi:hypothetical protein